MKMKNLFTVLVGVMVIAAVMSGCVAPAAPAGQAPAAAAPTTGGHEFAPFRGYELAKQAPAQDRVSRFVEHYCSQHGKGAAGVARHVTVSFLEFLANDGVHLDEAAEV